MSIPNLSDKTGDNYNRWIEKHGPDGSYRLRDVKTGIWYQFDTDDERQIKKAEILQDEKEADSSNTNNKS